LEVKAEIAAIDAESEDPNENLSKQSSSGSQLNSVKEKEDSGESHAAVNVSNSISDELAALQGMKVHEFYIFKH